MNVVDAVKHGSYAGGIVAIIVFFFGVFVCICILDLVCSVMHWRSIGYRVQRWSRRNPWCVVGLLLIFATLLTHFLANTIHY